MARERRPAPSVHFAAFVDPDSAKAWIPRTRAFLGLPTPQVDTSHVAVSMTLTSIGGSQTLLFARRRTDSGWTRDRYLIVRARADEPSQTINLSRQVAEQFLDSLTAVVLRTPLFTADRQRRPATSLAASD